MSLEKSSAKKYSSARAPVENKSEIQAMIVAVFIKSPICIIVSGKPISVLSLVWKEECEDREKITIRTNERTHH